MNHDPKTILVIDGGGRGSTLVAKYLQSPHVSKVLAIPGNDLMLELHKSKTVKIFPKIKTTNVKSIIKICGKHKVDLVDVAQDDAIAAGLVDELIKNRIKVFGPTKLAGQIEWDKAWAREFMKKFKIPSPVYRICYSQKEGVGFIANQKEGKWFVKASGLAAGKGAIEANSKNDALKAISQMKNFGRSGKIFLIEEALVGEEFSSFAIVDGINFKILGHAQDHKRVDDGDLGPNTGGMGCSSPPMVITDKIEAQIIKIFDKTVKGLASASRPYQGILYLGGMIDPNGKVYVIEFNARWGDPEAQAILPSIKNDYYQLVTFSLRGLALKAKMPQIKKDNLYRIVVTVASHGYPNDYSNVIGKQIIGIDNIKKNKEVEIHGAAVKKVGKKYLANGGRLFYVVGKGKNVAQARKIAYNALSLVRIDREFLHYRTDIGCRDLERFYKGG